MTTLPWAPGTGGGIVTGVYSCSGDVSDTTVTVDRINVSNNVAQGQNTYGGGGGLCVNLVNNNCYVSNDEPDVVNSTISIRNVTAVNNTAEKQGTQGCQWPGFCRAHCTGTHVSRNCLCNTFLLYCLLFKAMEVACSSTFRLMWT
jgi:hypothetical protein